MKLTADPGVGYSAAGLLPIKRGSDFAAVRFFPIMNKKWMTALACVLVMLGPGAVYSFSLLTQPLIAAFGWTTVSATWAFALANFFLGVGAAIGGIWQDRSGPRVVAITGVCCWGVGNILAGMMTPGSGLFGLYLTYGVLGGLGCGMVYIASVSCALKWFADRRGFGGGLVIMGFGLGAFFYNLIIKNVGPYAAIAKSAAAYTAARSAAIANHVSFDPAKYTLGHQLTAGLMQLFVYSGVTFLIFGAVFALLLANPEPELAERIAAQSAEPLVNQTTTQMLATPQFYLLWIMLFINVTAGIIVISNAVPIMSELTSLPATVVGSWYAFLAVFNGLGRLFWGAVSDRIGRRTTFGLVFGVQVIVFFFLDQFHNIGTVAASFAIILLCYGGGFGTMPAFNADFFGLRSFGANYGLTITAWGCAGIAGPWFVATVKDLTGSYAGALQPMAIMLLLAIVFPIVTDRSTKRDKAPRPTFSTRASG